MNITILGTAAAEGVPSLFCNCPTCKKSRKAGGRNIRSRSSLLINQDLKVDWAPDSFYHSIAFGMDTAKLKYLLISHPHHDHFAYQDIAYLRPGFAPRKKLPPLQLYGTKDAINIFTEQKGIALERNFIVPFKPFSPGKYHIVPIKAKHGTITPLNFIITQGKKSFLYTCDTGYYDDSTWKFLAKSGIKVNLVISECTGGPKNLQYGTHMGLPNVCEFRSKTQDIGLTNTKTKWILTHFTHNSCTTYDEIVPIAEKADFTVAYDGMKVAL